MATIRPRHTTRTLLTETTDGIHIKRTYLVVTWLRISAAKGVATTKVVEDVSLGPEADLTDLLRAS